MVYNEEKHGKFDGAVQTSNEPGGLTWLDKSRRKPEKLPCPIIVRLKGQERYFCGELYDVKLADQLDADFVLEERSHRPPVWLDRDKKVCPRPNKDFKSVFFIRALKRVPQRPREVENLRPPESPVYFDL
jgi:hypothetical protein